MTWSLCTSGAAINKAGANANSTIVASGAALAEWSDEAEGMISAELHTDATTLTDTQIVNALKDICSSWIGMSIIMYDSTGYIAREADYLMNRNDEIITKGLNKLKEKQNQRLST